MDYLDPQKKKAHRTRLFIGYGLLTVAIAFATVILIYLGSGYYLDRQTGDLIQNGQIFVNSDPEGAQIYLNDKQQKSKTANRLVLPSGSYKVGMKKDGYREWQQTIQLEGGKVQKLDYARLIPTDIKTTNVQTFASTPSDVSQSPDRKTLSIVFSDKPNVIQFYDLSRPEQSPIELTISPTTFLDSKKIGQIRVIEWTDDSKSVLVQNTFKDTVEDYFVINRTDAAQTKNLTQLFNSKAATISLRDRSADSVYLYNKTTKDLSIGSVADKTVTLKLSFVEQFESVGPDTILYATRTSVASEKAQIRLTDGGDKSYLIREYKTSQVPYLLAISKLSSNIVIATADPNENKVSIFRNPIGYLKANPDKALPLATTIFQVTAPSEVSFSTDASIVMARGGQTIASHYFEEDRSSRFELGIPLIPQKLRWTDGKHLQAISDGFVYMFDFDGANINKLVETNESFNAYFDKDYASLFSFSEQAKPFSINKSVIKLPT